MSDKITNLEGLMDEVMYDWEYSFAPGKRVSKISATDKISEAYVLNKLYITSDSVCYKTEVHKLDPKVFYQFETVFDMMYNDAPSIREICSAFEDKSVLADWLTSESEIKRKLGTLIARNLNS